MTIWSDQFGAAELRHFEETYGEEALADVAPCHGCGIPTPYVLLDAKDSGDGDFKRLECRDCYGPGWCPT